MIQHTVARGELPALVVIHDDEDYWLAGDGVGDPNAPGACGIYHMSHLVAQDPTTAVTLALSKGQVARRDSPKDQWRVEQWRYADKPDN